MKTLYLLLLLFFMSSCASKKASHPDIVDLKQSPVSKNINELNIDTTSENVSSQPKKLSQKEESLLVAQKIIGYGGSLPIAGVAYTTDGAIYLVGGTVASILHCWPTILVTAATSSSAIGPFCFNYEKSLFKSLDEYHPKLGKYFWQASHHWRH